MNESTYADKIRTIPMGIISGTVFFVVVVCGGIMKPWDAVISLLANQGLGEEEYNLLARMFGYTLPLAFGFFIVAYVFLSGKHKGFSWDKQLLAVALILWICGVLSKILGLGLSPTFSLGRAYQGQFLLWFSSMVLNGYVHTDGWPLVICALALGIGLAVWFERQTHSLLSESSD